MKSTTNFQLDKLPKVIKTLTHMVEDILPNSLYVLLSTAKEQDGNLVIGDRWMLAARQPGNYDIIDLYTKEPVHKGIARLQTAVSIISLIVKNPNHNITKIKQIEDVDRQFLRCSNDIIFYKAKMKATKDFEKKITLQFRLDHSQYQLDEIKLQLIKLYC